MIKIENILFWVLVIFSLFLVLWYVFGNSPTIEQTLLAIILTFVYSLYGEVKSLSHLPEEIKSVKDKVTILESKFTNKKN